MVYTYCLLSKRKKMRKKLFYIFILSTSSLWASAHGKGNEIDLSISGQVLTNAFSGTNKVKYGYSFINSGNPLAGIIANGTKLNSHNYNTMMSVDRSKINFTATKTSGVLKYSGTLIFTGDANATKSVKEAYITVDTPMGSFILGNTKGPEDRGACGPTDFVVGTGGTDGIFSRFLNTTTGISMAPSPVGNTKESTKFSFYSKRAGGIQVGFAYTPSDHHYGEASMNTFGSPLKKPLHTMDIKSYAPSINYRYACGGINLNLSAVALFATTKPERSDIFLLQRNNTKAYDFGIVFGAGSWTIGAEYIINGKSGTFANNLYGIVPIVDGLKLPSKNYMAQLAGKHYTINSGITYKTEDFGISFSYLQTSKRTGFVTNANEKSGRAKGTCCALSTEYYIAPGFSTYVEGAIYKMKNPDWAYLGTAIANLTKWEFVGVPSNRAKVTLIGLKMKF